MQNPKKFIRICDEKIRNGEPDYGVIQYNGEFSPLTFISSLGISYVTFFHFTALVKSGHCYSIGYNMKENSDFPVNVYWRHTGKSPEIVFTDGNSDEILFYTSSEVLSWACIAIREYQSKHKPTTTINMAFPDLPAFSIMVDSKATSRAIKFSYKAYVQDAYTFAGENKILGIDGNRLDDLQQLKYPEYLEIEENDMEGKTYE